MAAEGRKPPLTLNELTDLPLERIKGIGPKKAESLAKAGVANVAELLMRYPRRYIDRTAQAHITDLAVGDEVMVLARVSSISGRRTGNRRALVTADITDGTGFLRVTFFNQAWRERQLLVGTEAVFFGKVELFNNRRQMTNPIVDLIGDRTGKIVPVYPQSEKQGFTSDDLGRWIDDALAKCGPRGIADPVPERIRTRHELIGRAQALTQIHVPDHIGEVAQARKRLVYDELFRLQLALVSRKRAVERNAKGIQHRPAGDGVSETLVGRFRRNLSFDLTAAQERVIGEIFDDLASRSPMHRLLQGDVGSGKTVVAVASLLVAVQGGHQGALMAPTEVLAEQHFLGLRPLLDGITVPDPATLMGDRPLRVSLLTNRTTAKERRALFGGLANGEVDLVIGTHALLEDTVVFRSLGVVVVDEQHRFGVEQRASLRGKGRDGVDPDVLVMTATPIPRTSAMTVYGDLDVSVLDELPPGRKPIVTVWARAEDEQEEVWDAVRREVAAGRQAYVVCPLIDESEKLEVASATETYDHLRLVELAGLRLALLHGRVKAADKEATMAAFRRGEVDVLVATTVIEVGVDVPNASVMVILDANRFGIAQLHQLRGRVGRGADQSWCFLLGDATTDDGVRRLDALVGTTDGFVLAEADLEIRGEGQILGATQHGRTDLRLASLQRDKAWVAKARTDAFEVIDADPSLLAHPVLEKELELLVGEEEAAFLFKS